jgi:hypothetical protein
LKGLTHYYEQNSALIKRRKENARTSVKNPFLFEETIICMNYTNWYRALKLKGFSEFVVFLGVLLPRRSRLSRDGSFGTADKRTRKKKSSHYFIKHYQHQWQKNSMLLLYVTHH